MCSAYSSTSYKLCLGQGAQVYHASLSSLVSRENCGTKVTGLLWGPDESVSGCNRLYYHCRSISSSNSGLESGTLCPSPHRKNLLLNSVCLGHQTVSLLTMSVAISRSFGWESAFLRPVASRLWQDQAECLNLREIAKITPLWEASQELTNLVRFNT